MSAERQDTVRWLLLIHQVPPKPDYLRVKVGRRLQRVGAVAIKNSVYALPNRAESLEDFQWIRAEVVDGGGEAMICEASFVDGLTDEQLESLFQSARDAEYAEIAAAAREAREAGASVEELGRLRARLTRARAIDFHEATGRAMAEEAIRRLAADVEPASPGGQSAPSSSKAEYRGRTWVTRSGIFVDRIASAWLIRRFIDRDARFRFIDDAKRRKQEGDLRFDMPGGDFTHVGDRCTFETLLDRFELTDPALVQIAEVVHDIDLKDQKFAREDTAGIERVLTGIATANAGDEARLERGAQLFDDLYTIFSK